MPGSSITIVGAGIVGCLLFYELAKKYGKRVILLEENDIASGTTGASGGFVDLRQGDSFNQACAQYAYQYYKGMAQEADIGFKEIVCHRINNTLRVHGKAMVLDTKKLCDYLVLRSQSLGARCYIHRKVSDLKRHSGSVILACGSGFEKLFPSLSLDITYKSFQFNVYKNTMNLQEALISHDNDFYVIPKSDGHIVCGFLSRDVDCAPRSRPIINKKIALDIQAMLIKHYRHFEHKSPLFCTAAIDAFTKDRRGLFSATTVDDVFVAIGLSAHGITLSPHCIRQCVDQWVFSH
jgi:glycine/D-amino acid oxidase-like deaminating enzyme